MRFVTIELDGHVATVTLSRPEALNAISGEVANELAGALLQSSADPEAWVVVLGAAGERAFCVGADLKERNRLDDAGWLQNRILMRAMFDSLRAIPQPTVASVFGHALGGGFELALSCDLIVASDDAVFGLPEVRVGIVPGGGGTQLLVRKVGVARAKDLILTGRRISAAEALDIGLVAREVGPRDGLQAERPLSVDVRVRLLDALSATGLPKIEAVAFVSPKAVPAMADAAEVWRRMRKTSGVAYSALVPNRRGAEAAVEA